MRNNNWINWVNKEERAKQAQEHYEKMEANFSSQILFSVEETWAYGPDFPKFEKKEPNKEINVLITPEDSVSAIFNYGSALDKTAVLNFASYKNPGGMFLKGSSAQEESLCHESTLYNVLVKLQNYYNWNIKNKLNRALYFNRALYSPAILFVRGYEKAHCDVITCAAPNYTAASNYQGVKPDENYKILKQRVEFILDIAEKHGVETLILGAWGCGVFGQNPFEVATVFKNALQKPEHKKFKKIIFAIPKNNNNNFDAFMEVFNANE